ncbi:hypothetical protein DdX_11776 [Ditylenchus destructor]|uniref:small monomeric GTPase n=1 Tax=Ditylenchus destructor TaxID=166010 RepID=A0AAD4MYX4_9BILA|nr:hypothetical protein DdX_11776 [Ditylenchus destructor]
MTGASTSSGHSSVTTNSSSMSPPSAQTNGGSAGRKTETPPPEYPVLIIGTPHKQPLFEKLLASAEKFERHIQYQDTFYLNYTVDGQPAVVVLNDPGTQHTGAREMAIRKADAVILCYAAYNAASFHQISDLVNDFKSRKNGQYPPVLLLCNEDCILEEAGRDKEQDNGDKMARTPSTSEGYESSDEMTEREKNVKESAIRRISMEEMRNNQEECVPITYEQGETMAQLFGPDCRFLSISFQEYSESRQLVEGLIQRIRTNKSSSARSRKDRSSGSLLKSTIKRRRSIPHPLKIFASHHGTKKSENPQKSKSTKSKGEKDKRGSSSSSSESVVTPNSAFLGEISSPPRRSRSVNVQGEKAHVTAPPPRTDIWTRDDSAENTGEYIDDLHSNMHSPASGRSSSRYSPMSSHVTQPTPRHSPSTPSIHRLVIGDDPDDEGRFTYESAQATITSSISADPRMSPEHGQKENIVRTKSEGTVSETDQHSHKEKWGFRRVNQQGKSAACVVS